MKGIAELVRKKLKEDVGKGVEISAQELTAALNLSTQTEKARFYETMHDFIEKGEVKRLSRGVYMYIGTPPKKELKGVMWRLVRARKVVTIEDLQELSGASQTYVKEWLKILEKQGVVSRFKEKTYRLVKDTVVEPETGEKAIRKQELQRKKKEEALTALNDASIAIDTAKTALSALDAETD